MHDSTHIASKIRRQTFDYCPWTFYKRANPKELEDQLHYQKLLTQAIGAEFGTECYISPDAAIINWEEAVFQLGDNSYVGAHAYITGRVSLGRHCSVNPFVTMRENVQTGDDVRIGAHASLIGMNHVFSDPTVPIRCQPCSSKGIRLGNDVWVGSNATILDGVTVGNHCIIGAAAVVTKDVPDYAIVAGNPARVIRFRKFSGGVNSEVARKLRSFGSRIRTEVSPLLRNYAAFGGSSAGCYLNRRGERRRVRPWCDAVEIAAMFDGTPPGFSAAELVTRLRSWQDPKTGLVPEHIEEHRKFDPPPADHPDLAGRYNTMIVNYALECLGSNLPFPVANAAQIDANRLRTLLQNLDWKNRAWSAGDWIDCFSSCLLVNEKYFELNTQIAGLMKWLNVHCDCQSGLWGSPTKETQWLQPVNGFYRLTRGTYAQFGLPLPHPTKSIDTILEHSQDQVLFGKSGNACNVLDVVHPLWLCLKQTSHRRTEVEAWVRKRLPSLLDCWKVNEGFSFDLGEREYSLQGTEMWLSIIYLMSDLLGISSELGYCPKGVHRTAPAWAPIERSPLETSDSNAHSPHHSRAHLEKCNGKRYRTFQG